MSRQRCLVRTNSASMCDVIDAGEKALIIVYNKKLLTHWISSDINDSVRRWLQRALMLNYRPYHQHQQQQCTTVFRSSCEPSSPRMERICIWTSSNGLGCERVYKSLPLLLNICCSNQMHPEMLIQEARLVL